MKAADRLSGLASLLFVPAGNRRLLASAPRQSADAFIIDMEDAIPDADKAMARAGLVDDVSMLRGTRAHVGVRVNRPWTLMIPDLSAAVASGADFVMVPKVEEASDVRAVGAILAELDAAKEVYVISQIESASALGRMAEIAAARPDRQASLMFGPEDLSLDLGAAALEAVLTAYAQQLVAAARSAALIPIGSPGSIAEVADMEAYRGQIERGSRMGFAAVGAIHPRQVEVINAVYTPSPEDEAAACEIVTQDQSHGGKPFMLEGRMIDAPIVSRARATVLRAKARRG